MCKKKLTKKSEDVINYTEEEAILLGIDINSYDNISKNEDDDDLEEDDVEDDVVNDGMFCRRAIICESLSCSCSWIHCAKAFA